MTIYEQDFLLTSLPNYKQNECRLLQTGMSSYRRNLSLLLVIISVCIVENCYVSHEEISSQVNINPLSVNYGQNKVKQVFFPVNICFLDFQSFETKKNIRNFIEELMEGYHVLHVQFSLQWDPN